MSNTHEYVIFDRAKLDNALALRWPAFEKKYRGWHQWDSAREFLLEWGLGESYSDSVDAILARKTVRATLALSQDQFGFLRAILDEKDLWAGGVEIEHGDSDYGDDIVSCAGAAYARGDVSLATLAAVYQLHACRVDPSEVLLPEVASALAQQPAPPAMLPEFPNLMPDYADGIGIQQARRVIDFLRRAWDEKWPLQAEGQAPRAGESIRSCEVATDLYNSLKNCRLTKPCIYRWYEC